MHALLGEFERHHERMIVRARERRAAVALTNLVDAGRVKTSVSEDDLLGKRLPRDEFQGDTNFRTLKALLKKVDERGFERVRLAFTCPRPARLPPLSNPRLAFFGRQERPSTFHATTSFFCWHSRVRLFACQFVGLSARSTGLHSLSKFWVGPVSFLRFGDACDVPAFLAAFPPFRYTRGMCLFLLWVGVLQFRLLAPAFAFARAAGHRFVPLASTFQVFFGVVALDDGFSMTFSHVFIYHSGNFATRTAVVPVLPRIELLDPVHFLVVELLLWHTSFEYLNNEVVAPVMRDGICESNATTLWCQMAAEAVAEFLFCLANIPLAVASRNLGTYPVNESSVLIWFNFKQAVPVVREGGGAT